MSDKMTKKELKSPDAFQKAGAEAVPFIEQHGKTIVGVVVGVLVVGGGFSIARELSERGQAVADKELGAALKVMARPVNAAGTLDEQTGELPFKTDAEKEEAVIQALTEFRGKNAGKRAAANAALPLGQALLRQGKADEGLKLVEEYLKNSEVSDPLRPEALEAKGYALEALKKPDEALAAFDQLAAENTTEFLQGMGKYHRGRILLGQGKSEEAAKLFVDLQTAAPGSSAARLAADRVSLLAASGVKIPQAALAADAGL
jgi:tetratricopeptide (TPR) repeat protein